MADLDNSTQAPVVAGPRSSEVAAHGEGRAARGRRLDRVLLLAVLVLQVAILGMLLKERFRPTDPRNPVGTVADSAPVSTVPSARPRTTGLAPAADDPAAVAASLRHSRAMFDRMDALFEQTVSEIAAMDRLFDTDAGWQALPVSPFLDMRDTGNRYVVVYGVPGMRPSDVKVVLDDRILTIHALLEYPPYVQHFGHSLQMDRSLRLPGPVGDPSEANAGITNGLLRVDLPKAGTPVRVLAVPVRLY